MTSAAELEGAIRKHFPKARLTYKPDPLAMAFHGKNQGIKFEDAFAEKEWAGSRNIPWTGRIEDFTLNCGKKSATIPVRVS